MVNMMHDLLLYNQIITYDCIGGEPYNAHIIRFIFGGHGHFIMGLCP